MKIPEKPYTAPLIEWEETLSKSLYSGALETVVYVENDAADYYGYDVKIRKVDNG